MDFEPTICELLKLFAGRRFYYRLYSPSASAPMMSDVPLSSSQTSVQPSIAPVPAPYAGSTAVAPVGVTRDEFIPRLHARPETAPLYDELRKPTVMPVVAGCFQIRGSCRCITQQGTDAFLSNEECIAWIASPPFNPWKQLNQQQQGGPGVSAQPGLQGLPDAVPQEANQGSIGGVIPCLDT
jgi:hypothetical protein